MTEEQALYKIPGGGLAYFDAPDDSDSDEEFERLKKRIQEVWAEYDLLQGQYRKLTGQRYRWFGGGE